MDSGFYLIDKEDGVSSAKVVSSLKKKFNLKKVGHSGTLDPFATGLLVCPCSMATRLASFIQDAKKTYSGVILLGIKTDSDDITGNIISKNDVISFDKERLLEIRNLFLGNITQIPPKLSAIKINGKRAYDKFRNNEDFEMKERKVTVNSFDILEINGCEVSFRIECSKGTYIRAIARDFGDKLGTFATLKTLRREVTGIFNVKNAKKIDEVLKEDMIPWYKIFSDDIKLLLSDSDIKRLNVGDNVLLEKLSKSSEYGNLFLENDMLYYYSSNDILKSGVLIKKDNKWQFAVNGI